MSKCVAFVVLAVIAHAWAQQRYCGSISVTTCGSQARPGCTVITSTTTATSSAACEQQCLNTANCWYFEYVGTVGAPSTCTLYADAGGCAGCATPVGSQTGSETGYCNAACKSVQPGQSASDCNDNNDCTTDSCDPTTGSCVNTAIGCDDGNLCTTDQCDPATGLCSHYVRACFQSVNNKCNTNVCVPSTGNCTSIQTNCDDGNLCTVDSCDASTGCIHTPVTCGDTSTNGLSCTVPVCNPATGKCDGTGPRNCTDTDPCTQDYCLQGRGCEHPPTCNQTTNCTTQTCNRVTGACTSVGINCDDGLDCTDDSCNLAVGCVHTVSAKCDDGNMCTTDQCTAKGCTHSPVLCPFALKSCTVYSCDPKKGCVASKKNCDDSNACTDDTCVGDGQCVHTPNCVPKDNCTWTACNVDTGSCEAFPADCNDGLECTVDTCVLPSGCVHTSTCNDKNLCTTDTCDSDGTCKYSPKLCLSILGSCTTSHCDSTTGACVSAPVACTTPPSTCWNSPGTCVPNIGHAPSCTYTPKAAGTGCTVGTISTLHHCDGQGNCVPTVLSPIVGTRSAKFDTQAVDSNASTAAPHHVLAYGGSVVALVAVIAVIAVYLSRRSHSEVSIPEVQNFATTDCL